MHLVRLTFLRPNFGRPWALATANLSMATLFSSDVQTCESVRDCESSRNHTARASTVGRIGLDSSSSLTHFVRMSPRRSTHRRLDTEQQVQTVRKKSSPAEVMRHKKMRELIEVARARVPQKVDRRKPLIFIRSFGRAEKGLTTPDLLERMVPKTWLRLCGLQPHLPSVPDGEVPPSRQKPMVGGQHSGGTGWGQYRGAFHRLDCTTRSACRPA